ncbi:SDR family NAD(P)-dependent oxidoreductase [Alteribacillus sp. HJP-4]|uniref:SDR family NAD(P)-dependent oxidoreductase n=1 Tax=Alteribacillus sp. HJP-4 TaxID=2775394 RepID=UPI0035CCD09B
MKKLNGKAALVTGASRGMGAAIAKRLAEEGADVVLNYFSVQEENDAEAIKRQVEDIGARASIIAGDVGVKDDVTNMVEFTASTYGSIDILVNNAGIAPFFSFLNIDEETWDRTYDTNVKGVFLTCQAAAPYMIKQKAGKIINIASTASLLVTSPVMPHYISSKAAVNQLTRALAIELGSFNINVNAVGPSTTATDMVTEYLEDKEIYNKEVEANPMKRLGTTKHIADAVAFLASDDAEQVNGHLLMVDGGLTVKAAQPEDNL